MDTEEKQIEREKDSKEIEPLEVEEEGVSFDARITSFKLEDGVALFEFETQQADQTYVSTMDATVKMEGKSEFQEFVDSNNIERSDISEDNLPLECQVISRRVQDVIKFEINRLGKEDKTEQNGETEYQNSKTIDKDLDDTVKFKEFPSLAMGLIAGVVPLSNILLFGVMLASGVDDNMDNNDVMFLYGMMVSMVSSIVILSAFLG
jgi:hypothetical protein